MYILVFNLHATLYFICCQLTTVFTTLYRKKYFNDPYDNI